MRRYTTRRLVAALMEEFDIESKYGVAKILGVSHKTVRNWVDDGKTMNEQQAKKAASLLGIDYEYVLICIQIERSKKNPVAARAWAHVAEIYDSAKVAVFALLSIPLIAGMPTPFGLV